MKWLGRVHQLELEIKLLESERDKYTVSLKARGVPDPESVGGHGSGISKPTEDSAVSLYRYTNKISKIMEQIQLKDDDIEAIKNQTEMTYYESDMKAEWYQSICYYYFDHMSLCEISKKVGYEVSTVKKHKEKGVGMLTDMLPCTIK